MKLGEMIALYRKQAGMTIDDLAEKSKVPKGTLNKIIAGTTKAPTLETIRSIAYALGKTLNDFDDTLQEEKYSASEKWLIKKYRDLDDHGKEAINSCLAVEYKRMEELRRAAEQSEEAESKDKVVIPLMRNRASAGDGVSLEDDDYVPIVVDRTYESERADFAVRVTGRSMEPKYYDGDILLVRKQPAVDIGQIGIFVIGDNGYVKRQQADRLESLNPEYDDIYPSEYDDVHCSGLVLGKL